MYAPDVRLSDTSAPLPYLEISLRLSQADEGANTLFDVLRLASLMVIGLFPPAENCPCKRPEGGPVGGGMDVVVMC